MHLTVNIATVWQPDDALLDLIKDREVLDRIVAEVAGEQVAQANAGATGKVKRGIIRDCLRGEGGRAKVEGWVPRWMAFPPAVYTECGGVGTVQRAQQVAEIIPTRGGADAAAEAPANPELAQAA